MSKRKIALGNVTFWQGSTCRWRYWFKEVWTI